MRVNSSAATYKIADQEIRDAAYDLYLKGNSIDLIRWHLGVSDSVIQREVKAHGKRSIAVIKTGRSMKNRILIGADSYKHLVVPRYRPLYGA